CYRHTQFPKEYQGGMFLCDWTFGKIHFAALKRNGASYEAKPQVFLEATGDEGFAPTALLVHPETGDLFVAIGGRGTRGAVYRVRYDKGIRKDMAPFPTTARSLDWQPHLQKKAQVLLVSANSAERLWALQAMTRHAGQFTELARWQ